MATITAKCLHFSVFEINRCKKNKKSIVEDFNHKSKVYKMLSAPKKQFILQKIRHIQEQLSCIHLNQLPAKLAHYKICFTSPFYY